MKKILLEPIGSAPYYTNARNKILSLAQAISKYASEYNHATEPIRAWTEEIMALCDLLDKIEKGRDGVSQEDEYPGQMDMIADGFISR